MAMHTIRQKMARRRAREAERRGGDAERFAVDSLLRRRGFRVLSRRRGQEAEWERGGKSFPQSLALRECPAVDLVRARAQERAHRELRQRSLWGECEGR